MCKRSAIESIVTRLAQCFQEPLAIVVKIEKAFKAVFPALPKPSATLQSIDA